MDAHYGRRSAQGHRRCYRLVMRVVGALFFVAGIITSGYTLTSVFRAARPRDVGYAVAAILAVAVAIGGLVLAVAPPR